MPTALTTVCLAAALLVSGRAAAQQTAAQQTADAAGAEAAVTRLVTAWLEKDWTTVARFVDPETASAAAHDARFGLVGEDVTADSLRALAAAADAGTLPDSETGSDADWQAMARVYRWIASLDGEPTDAAVVARVLDIVDRCDREHTFYLRPVQYKPVGSAVVGGNAVDVVGRFYAVGPDGRPDPGESILAITPVVWEAGRWTVDELRTSRQDIGKKDVDLNPIVRFLTWSRTQWGYAIAYTVSACEDESGQGGVRE